ncbi:MAG: glycosyltransferase [Desulfotomaculaceae bacterium]|nr:glycosyltransferase [Desulfotomaculaceae bacterium]
MKLGIDASFLNRTHSGGKEQVLFNLLKGFQAIGKARNIHIFTYDYSAAVIKGLIPDANFTFIPYPNTSLNKTIVDSLFKTFKLDRLVKQHGIDVLFFPHFNTGLKKFKIPTVVLPHDIQVKSNAGRFALKDRVIYGLQYYFDFKLRTKIVAISDYDFKEIEKYYPQHKAKIKRIYNPVDTDFSLPPEKHSSATPYICAINIAYRHKNTITLIKAFEKIMHKIDHNLVLIGRIKQETDFLRTYVSEHDLGKRVIFTGFLKEQELNRVLSHASLYVNPSLFEGFGMTAIEAALRCVPVLTSVTGATLEVTRKLLNYYDPAGDDELLAKKMLELLHTEQPLPKLAAIKEDYMACYAYTAVSKRYYEFFGGLMQ